MIYTKLSKISQYTAKTQELGKIINMLSNDFNTIETKSPIFFASMITPFALAGIIAILITRFGWPGILILCVIFFFLPFQILVSKMNSTIIQKVNIYKDKRIKVCTEIIEGIKFIKLYGWEIAFKHIIQALRKEEIRDYIKLSFGRSLERAIGNIAASSAGFTCFIVMDITK